MVMVRSPENDMKKFQQTVAMTVTLISFGMLFASLFLGYFLVRFNAPVWPPVEIEKLPKLLPFLSTVVIALSSFAYNKFEESGVKSVSSLAMHKTESSRRMKLWRITIVLGGLFLVLQFVLWKAMADAGILVGNGNVTSMVYAFSWIHAAHIVAGLGLLLWLRYLMGYKQSKLTEGHFVNVGKFWHFLGIVWILMYLMLFVL